MSTSIIPIRMFGWYVEHTSEDGAKWTEHGSIGSHDERVVEAYLRRKFADDKITTISVWEDEQHMPKETDTVIPTGDTEPRQVSLYPTIPQKYKTQSAYQAPFVPPKEAYPNLPTYDCFTTLLFPELSKHGSTTQRHPIYDLLPKEK